MLHAVDATNHDEAPVRDYNPWAAYFFVVFLLVGAFFFLNIFIAVIFEKFVESKKSESATVMYLRPD